METIEIKKEVHEYIEHADDRLLFLIYGLILADKQATGIPDWHQRIVEERLEDYKKKPEQAISWDELRSKIEKMR